MGERVYVPPYYLVFSCPKVCFPGRSLNAYPQVRPRWIDDEVHISSRGTDHTALSTWTDGQSEDRKTDAQKDDPEAHETE